MSGQRIDDRSSWAGKAPEGEVFPEGNRKRFYTSAEGVGELGAYQDTSEAIKKTQEKGKAKVKSHAQPNHERN